MKGHAQSVCYIVIAYAVMVLSATAFSQDEYERVRPKEPTPHTHTPGLPDLPADVPGDETVLVQALKGVLFLPMDGTVEANPAIEGLQTGRVPLLDHAAFRQRIEAYLNQPVTMKLLNRIVRETILFHRQLDRPLVDVVVPEQDITTGTVQLVVIEGKVGQVKIEGNRWFSESVLRRRIKTGPGDTVHTTKLRRELESINRNPFRDVNVLFTPGTGKGLTDVIYQVNERFPVRFYAGYEDTGNQLLGEDRQLYGFNWGNAFLQDMEMGYQFTTSIEIERYRAHSGYLRMPLPWGEHQLSLFGSHSSTEATIDQDFDTTGTVWQIGLRYMAPLPDLGKYRHCLQGGFDFKRADSNLLFGGSSAYQAVTDVVEFSLEYSGSAPDRLGTTTFAITGTGSPGGMTANQLDRVYETARAGARADYLYGTMVLERVWNLPQSVTLSTKFTGQVSNRNLLGSEQLGFGGFSTIRGYYEREYNADEGILTSVELRSPRFMLGKIGDLDPLPSYLQAVAFWDYGYGWNREPLPSETGHDLSSTGLGLRYNMGVHISVRFDAAWRLERGFTQNDGFKMHIGAVVSY